MAQTPHYGVSAEEAKRFFTFGVDLQNPASLKVDRKYKPRIAHMTTTNKWYTKFKFLKNARLQRHTERGWDPGKDYMFVRGRAHSTKEEAERYMYRDIYTYVMLRSKNTPERVKQAKRKRDEQDRRKSAERRRLLGDIVKKARLVVERMNKQRAEEATAKSWKERLRGRARTKRIAPPARHPKQVVSWIWFHKS